MLDARAPSPRHAQPANLPLERQPATATRIEALAHRIERLAPPGSRDPERYWRDKGQLAHELRQIARELPRG